MTPSDLLVVFPHRVRRLAFASAGAVLVVFIALAFTVSGDRTGIYFRAQDQVAVVLFGMLLAGAILLLARPRLRVDTGGVGIRNVLGEQYFAWALVRGVSFPRTSAWARLELPEDEFVPIMAVRAGDGERAAVAIAALRELVHAHAPQTRTPPPEHGSST
ncbi:MAG: PH domain-containing protein [Mycobacteriaceae bacterium]